MTATYIERTGNILVHRPAKPRPKQSEGCTCGCGKDRATAVREMMRAGSLTEDQAEWRLDRANALRREYQR